MFGILFLFTEKITAQISIDTTISVDTLVKNILLGQGVAIGNVEYKGNLSAIGYFTTDNDALGIDKGIILSSGSVFNGSGPNSSPFITTAFQGTNLQPLKGDRDLNRICHGASWDAAVIEFDFIPFNNKISFSYVFGSDEYPEYVGSAYNDVFGFVVTGPKITRKNIALLPGTSNPVTINSVNATQNPDLFIDNDYFKKVKLVKVQPTLDPDANSTDDSQSASSYKIDKKKLKKLDKQLVSTIQYDGVTKVLEAWTYVVPFQKYHIKIAIGDVGDNTYDSGVLLQAGTFHTEKSTDQPKFKDYADISSTLNIDSIFGIYQKPTIDKVKQDSIEAEADHFSVTNINFESDSYIIPDSSKTELENLAAYLSRHPNFVCNLYGYTDNVGSKKYNQDLSLNRATAVLSYLESKGVSKNKMKIAGYNFQKPLADNTSEEGRALNRRVEIVLIED